MYSLNDLNCYKKNKLWIDKYFSSQNYIDTHTEK